MFSWRTLLGFGSGFVAGWAGARRTRVRADHGEVEAVHDAAEVERRRLRAVLDALPVGIFITAADGRMLETNPAVGEIWDTPAPPLFETREKYGEYKAFWPETGKRVQSHEWGTARVLATGEPIPREELEIETFAGRRKTILHYALPIRDEAGRVVEAVAVNVDVTDRKRLAEERERLLVREREARAEAERRAREEMALREAVDALSRTFSTERMIRQIAERAVDAVGADGAFVTRIDIARSEVEAVAIAGERATELGSRRPYTGSFTAQVVESEQPLVAHLPDAPAEPRPGELASVCPGCAVAVIPLIGGGEPIGALFLFRQPPWREFRPDEIARASAFGDLAALAFRRVHMLEDSERRREELERVTESRARLMRGFSHDVKNPLGAADGHARLVEDELVGELTEKQKHSIRRIRHSIGSALELIDRLLELARAEAGQIEIEPVSADVREAAREIGEEHRAQAEAAGLALRLELPDSFPLIESDASRVRQILGNLVGNALKYTEKGSVTVRVELRSNRNAPGPGEWVAVSVSDSGPGIPDAKQPFVFEEFTRIEPSARRGAGLGLAISRRIARALGGDITLESRVGVGSTFTLWLPRRIQVTQHPHRAAD